MKVHKAVVSKLSEGYEIIYIGHRNHPEPEAILALDKSIVFVLNDVGCGIIPDNALAREFIDISGKLSQLIASSCDEVYHTIAGISTRIK